MFKVKSKLSLLVMYSVHCTNLNPGHLFSNIHYTLKSQIQTIFLQCYTLQSKVQTTEYTMISGPDHIFSSVHCTESKRFIILAVDVKNNLKKVVMCFCGLYVAWYNLSIYLFINVCVCYCFVLKSVCYIEYFGMLK